MLAELLAPVVAFTGLTLLEMGALVIIIILIIRG